jgi:hypothetical protein
MDTDFPRINTDSDDRSCFAEGVGAIQFRVHPWENRGRNARYRARPAQNRTCPIKASGSHLGCLTRKRVDGQGWMMRGFGSHWSAIRVSLSHGVLSF